MSNRQLIIDDLVIELSAISVSNGYKTDFFDVRIWDDIPVEYTRNEILIRDPIATFEKKSRYESTARVEIVAIVIEDGLSSASELGNIALDDLIKAALKVKTCRSIITLIDAQKFIETKGKTACEIALNLDIKFVV